MRRNIGSFQLGFDVRGAGPALVLLHAFPLDRRMWDETAAALAERHRVITVDARGFGESELPAGPASIAEMADDVARLLDALGVPMAALGGLSMGGYIALAFAERHAARLAALILADTRAGADSPDARRGRDEAIARVRAEGAAPLAHAMAERLLAPRADEALRERVRALGAAQPPEAIAQALVALRDRPDRTAGLGAIGCPTLVVVGADDAITPPAEARALKAAIPGARLVEIPGAGHLTNLEAPGAFTSAVGDFLDGV